MKPEFTLEELAAGVQQWCDQHDVAPASGQAAEQLSERTIRYYRTLGLLDAPVSPAGTRFTEKHRLQLIAIRLLQARGLPLRQIRELLYGRSLADLKEIERRGVAELDQAGARSFGPKRTEQWAMTPLSDDYLLVSRRGNALPAALLRRITNLLRDHELKHADANPAVRTKNGE